MAAHLSRKLVTDVENRCSMFKLLTALAALTELGISPRSTAQWLAEGHSLIQKGKRWDQADCRTPDCLGAVFIDLDNKGPLARTRLEASTVNDDGPECSECGQRQWIVPTIREECCIRLARLDSKGSTEMLTKAYDAAQQFLDAPLATSTPPVIAGKAATMKMVMERLDPRFADKREVKHTGSVQIAAAPAFTMGLSDAQLERISPRGLASLQSIDDLQRALDIEARKVIEAELSGESYEPRLPFVDLPALALSAAE
jgi:hypothetical protein